MIKKMVRCWEVFKCNEEKCPAYKSRSLKCWLVSGTHCRNEIEGKSIKKIEMCLKCKAFKANMDITAIQDTTKVINKQFSKFSRTIKQQDKELEDVNKELALGLSEVLEALNRIASGDPRIRISEVSKNELIAKLQLAINMTAKEIGIIVDQSHEFAIGLAEHFDVLNRVSKGEMSARISEVPQDELLRALGKVTNHMIENVSREITERKKTEEEIREHRDHLDEMVKERTAELQREIDERKQAQEKIINLNKDLNHHAMKLEVTNKEIEAFSYSVSHDLRAPLRTIDGFSSVLLEDHADKLDDEGKRLLNVIQGNTKRMGELIDDLLALSRVGRKEIEMSDIDMNNLANTVVNELETTIPERKIQFTIKPLHTACGDPGMIRQVFFNLLSNAIKFTRPREVAIIEVGGYAEGLENVYYVKDNGAGFDMQHVNKLFGTFQRLHSEREFEGTGIGLAIVQRIINRHGGRVWTEGKVDEGATFYFTLARGTFCPVEKLKDDF